MRANNNNRGLVYDDSLAAFQQALPLDEDNNTNAVKKGYTEFFSWGNDDDG
jgi:hypothetical protein